MTETIAEILNICDRHADRLSWAAAAHMAGLNFDSFKTRLTEHFNQGYIMADECVLEELHTVEKL